MKTKTHDNHILNDLSSFVSHLPIAVFVVDEKGGSIFCNQVWLNATGLAPEEYKSFKAKDILGSGFSEKFIEMVLEVFSGKKPDHITVPIVNKIDGNEAFFKISGDLFQAKYAVFSAIDVSETIKLQQTLLDKKEQFFSIIKSLGDVVFKLDRKGNYKNAWSSDASNIFSDRITFEGKCLGDHFPEEVVSLFQEAVEKSISTDLMVDMEFPCSHNQEEKWFLAKIAPIHVKNEVRVEEVTAIIREITEERKNRQQIEYKLKQRDRILTKSGIVAKIGGWEHDVKFHQTILTDEIFDIYEVERTHFNIDVAISYYIKEHRPIIRKHVEDLLKNGKGFEADLQILTGKGNKKWVKSVGCAEWHDGQITRGYGILQDITEKKEKDLILQESERRFNAAFELAPIGIGLVSPEGQWVKANLALCRFFGYPEEELKKISLEELKLIQDLNNALKLAKKSLKKKLGIYQLEKKYWTKGGKVKWGNLSINIVKNEEEHPVYAIIQIVDVTKNKKFKEDLIIAKKEADEANKAKSNFLSSMSHEIRTPLNGVTGITNLLLEELNESQHREKLEALKFSSDSLLLIVNDILDYSKIKSGALTLEANPFVLRRLVEAVKESHIQKANELGNKIFVHYDNNLPEKLIGDELRIGQILNNLVNNSVKFTRNGIIDISIKKVMQSGEWNTLLFSIKDNGIGIPKDMQSVIFDQFIQAESGTSRRYGGTGLGLSIVKGLLKEMNSETILTSELGNGTEISFQLNLKSAKANQKSDNVDLIVENKDLKHKTILLVEDNSVNTMVVSDYIIKWKGEIIKAENGMKAIDKFLKNMDKINLILMDLEMPVMNGFEATEQIKKIKPDMPVIAMTASLGDKSKLDAYDYGMAAYVMKPFLPNDFYNTIKTHIL
ncbi:MAG: PAS domain S-box protein [Anditalea sp.]